jgi:hypothetical protein
MGKVMNYLELHFCDCGRPWCDFFDPSEDEGHSYSVEKVREFLKDLPKIKKHLQAELRKWKRVNEKKTRMQREKEYNKQMKSFIKTRFGRFL